VEQDGAVVTILGKQWELVFQDRLKRLPDGRQARGWCDQPDTKSKKIRIRSGMDDEETLDTVVHEMLHGAGWHIDEEFVTQFSRDVAAAITRLGWHRDCKNH
jgi:hypothetical protein